jgi:hypothetical protein
VPQNLLIIIKIKFQNCLLFLSWRRRQTDGFRDWLTEKLVVACWLLRTELHMCLAVIPELDISVEYFLQTLHGNSLYFDKFVIRFHTPLYLLWNSLWQQHYFLEMFSDKKVQFCCETFFHRSALQNCPQRSHFIIYFRGMERLYPGDKQLGLWAQTFLRSALGNICSNFSNRFIFRISKIDYRYLIGIFQSILLPLCTVIHIQSLW